MYRSTCLLMTADWYACVCIYISAVCMGAGAMYFVYTYIHRCHYPDPSFGVQVSSKDASLIFSIGTDITADRLLSIEQSYPSCRNWFSCSDLQIVIDQVHYSQSF